MVKAKGRGGIGTALCRLLGERRALSLVARGIARHGGQERVVFGRSIEDARSVVLMLPAEPLAALYCMPAVLSLIARFREGHCVLFCEEAVGAYFSGIGGIGRTIAYGAPAPELFSSDYRALDAEVNGEGFDVCVLLDPAPAASVIALAGRTLARVRAGFAGAGPFPFLNLRVEAAPGPRYAPDRLLALTRALGAEPVAPVRWRVAKNSREETDQLLRESNMAPGAALVGIDALYFFEQFGEEWTGRLLDRLRDRDNLTLYLYGETAERPPGADVWLSRQRLPLFHGLSVPMTAALVDRSAAVISGGTPFFEVSRLLQKPSIGVFGAGDSTERFREAPWSRAVVFGAAPDDATIRDIAGILDEFLSGR